MRDGGQHSSTVAGVIIAGARAAVLHALCEHLSIADDLECHMNIMNTKGIAVVSVCLLDKSGLGS